MTDIPPTLTGRVYLLLAAAEAHDVCTSDDAVLPGESDGRRAGNPNLVGAAVLLAHHRGWIRPLFAADGRRMCMKSRRPARSAGPVECWQRTDTTAAALVLLRQRLDTPPRRGLFDDIIPD